MKEQKQDTFCPDGGGGRGGNSQDSEVGVVYLFT